MVQDKVNVVDKGSDISDCVLSRMPNRSEIWTAFARHKRKNSTVAIFTGLTE